MAEYKQERELDERIRPAAAALLSAWTEAFDLLEAVEDSHQYDALAEIDENSSDDGARIVMSRFGRGRSATSLHDWFKNEAQFPPVVNAPVPRSFRGYLLQRWTMTIIGEGRPFPDGLQVLAIPEDPHVFPELPSDHTLAVIALLCGEFPEFPPYSWSRTGLTVSQVLDREARDMRRARGHVLPSELHTVQGLSVMGIARGDEPMRVRTRKNSGKRRSSAR